MKRQLVMFLVGATLSLGPMIAADGAIPIWEPTTITESGSYVVTRNITTTDDSCMISIATDDVDVDLNGFTLMAQGSFGGGVCAQDVKRIKVRNGKIFCEEGWAVSLVNVEGFEIRQIKARSTDDETFHVQGTKGFIEDNQIVFSQDGINLSSGSEVTIRGNSVFGQIIVNADRCVVTDNTLAGSGKAEIDVYGNGNQVTSNVARMIFVGDGSNNLIKQNVLDGSVLVGIDVGSSGNYIEGNLVANSGQYGIQVTGDRNFILANLVTGSQTFGLFFRSGGRDNVYRGNVARGNNGAGCANPTGTADFCDEGTNNTSHGDNYIPGKM